MSTQELRQRQAAEEHARASMQHATEAGKDAGAAATSYMRDTTTSAGQRASEMKEKLVHTAEDVSREAQMKARQVQSQAKGAWRDTITFMRTHPWMTAALLAFAVTLGMALAGSGFTFGFLARDAFHRYGRSSPQYKAHQALDTVLQSYYGPSNKWAGEGMTTAAYHKLQDAYHELTSMLGSAKDSVFGSSDYGGGRYGRSGESRGMGAGIADYFTKGAGGGSSSRYGRGGYSGEEPGYWESMKEGIKSVTGTTDMDEVRDAEAKLRRVLKNRGHGEI